MFKLAIAETKETVTQIHTFATWEEARDYLANLAEPPYLIQFVNFE